MQISSRFTVAVHIFACIAAFEKDYKLTSDFLAGSVNVNPVIIRRILQQLKAADLITVSRGSGDVYNAVECVDNGNLFHFHENPNPECPVGRNIHNSLDDKLYRIQQAMEDEMCKITIFDIVKDIQSYIEQENK